jgi:hypothetical protein
MQKTIPGPMWIAILSLGIIIAIQLLIAVFTLNFKLLMGLCISGALLYGLFRGHKWAYVLTMVSVLFGTMSSLRHGVSTAMGVFLLDCLVLIPTLVCTKWFFPDPDYTRQ